MADKHYIIFYDIADTRRRNWIVKNLEDYGYRIQYSVFEMTIPENRLKQLRLKLLKIIEPDEDSLKIYELEEDSWNKRQSYGTGQLIQCNKKYEIL